MVKLLGVKFESKIGYIKRDGVYERLVINRPSLVCDCISLPVSSGIRARFTLGTTSSGSGTLFAIGSVFQCISGLHTSNNLSH